VCEPKIKVIMNTKPAYFLLRVLWYNLYFRKSLEWKAEIRKGGLKIFSRFSVSLVIDVYFPTIDINLFIQEIKKIPKQQKNVGKWANQIDFIVRIQTNHWKQISV